MRYKDQLVLTGKINDVGAYTRTNIPASYRFGVELQAATQLLPKLKWDANLSLSENKVLKFTDYVDDYDFGGQQSTYYFKSDIAFSPGVIASSTITLLPGKNIEAALVSKYTGLQFLDNTWSSNKKLNAYFLNDIRLMWTTKAKFFREINLIGQINNIFDVKYEPAGYTFSYYYLLKLTTENYYYPMAGVNFMVGLNLKL
jgi:iron complex outermembrane receptor protein